MKTFTQFLGIIAIGAVIMAGLGGCASAPPTVWVQVTRAEAKITNPPLLGEGMLDVKKLAVQPFTVPDTAVMALTYDFAEIAHISAGEVDKAFGDVKALTTAAGNDVAAIQATLKTYPGAGDAAGVLATANKLAGGSATTDEVLKIVNPGVAVAYAESKGLLGTVAKTLTGDAENSIKATGRFTLVDADAADAVFRGEVTTITAEDGTHEESKKEYVTDANGTLVRDEKGRFVEQTISWMVYDRNVSLAFGYGVERAADGIPIGRRLEKSGQAKDQKNENNNGESRSDLKDFLSLVQGIAKLGSLSREVAPYETTEKVTLESLELELTKDKAQRSRIGSRQTEENRTLEPLEKEHKAFKARFKEADALAEQRNYQGARTAYGSIYKESGSFGAGYNEAIMAEAAGNLDEAISLMSALSNATKNPKAGNDLTRLKRDLREKQVLKELL
jgi:hypothetical protein